MTESERRVVRAIEANLSQLGPYSLWTIGSTEDPGRCERRKRYPGFWRYWDAGRAESALAIASYFADRGMKLDPEGHAPPGRYVFVY